MRLCSDTTARLPAPLTVLTQGSHGQMVSCQPLTRSQPSRAGPRSHHHAARAQECGRLVGLWFLAPKAALARLLSASGSEGLEPGLAPTSPGLQGSPPWSALPDGWGKGRGQPSAQPGCDPRKPRVTLLRGCCSSGAGGGDGWDKAVTVVPTIKENTVALGDNEHKGEDVSLGSPMGLATTSCCRVLLVPCLRGRCWDPMPCA